MTKYFSKEYRNKRYLQSEIIFFLNKVLSMPESLEKRHEHSISVSVPDSDSTSLNHCIQSVRGSSALFFVEYSWNCCLQLLLITLNLICIVANSLISQGAMRMICLFVWHLTNWIYGRVNGEVKNYLSLKHLIFLKRLLPGLLSQY